MSHAEVVQRTRVALDVFAVECFINLNGDPATMWFSWNTLILYWFSPYGGMMHRLTAEPTRQTESESGSLSKGNVDHACSLGTEERQGTLGMSQDVRT
jgi:hypothetical protein